VTDIDVLKKENLSLKSDLEQANSKIQHLEEEMITAFTIGDAVMDGIVVVDSHGVIQSVNKGYTIITEIKADEVTGRHIDELLEEKLFVGSVSLEVIKTGEKKTGMCTISRNNKQVLLVGSPIFNHNGELVKVITVMRNLTELINLKERLLKAEEKKRKAQDQLDSLKREVNQSNFIGISANIVRVKELIDYVAPTDANVLVLGPTGAGKEVVSRAIHQKSKRCDKPYIKINCAAIPENLLESELFGYVKGAFTGASGKDKKGLFESANGGTILLDEISEMPLTLQPKLLRVLQEREITPVGGVESIKIDTRVIAASNKDLKSLVGQKKFRADLFYRLNVFPIEIESLANRKDDIPDLVTFFINKYNQKYKKMKSIDNTALVNLMLYSWPGNVRELENVVERMVIMSSNKILVRSDVKEILNIGEVAQKNMINELNDDLGLKDSVRAYERVLIEDALNKGGSSYGAARILKTTQPTVIRKARALGIDTSLKRK